MFSSFPLLSLPVVLYNLMTLLFVQGGFKGPGAQDAVNQMLVAIPTTSGTRWSVTFGDMLIFISLVILFIELLKSTTSRRTAIINHSLSMILFIICLVEFLLFPAFASSAFFLLTSMVLLDVLAGFIVTIASARRDIDIVG